MSNIVSDPDSKLQQRLSIIEELEADKDNIIRNSTIKTFELPEIFKFDFDKTDHRWNKKDADLTDYFNYGFNEETWKLYVNKVRKLALKLNPTEYRIESDNLPDSESLNELDDYFPIDLGGFSNVFFKDMFENLGENFADDKILAHCASRKKYGTLDYDNISLDNFLNYFLNSQQKPGGSLVFEKLIKMIKTKNEEHSKDIYQLKKHLKPHDKRPLIVPPPWQFMPRFPPMGVFPPFMNPGATMLPPFIKPPAGTTQLPGMLGFDFMHNTLGSKFGLMNDKEKEKDKEKDKERESSFKYESKHREKSSGNNGFKDRKEHNREKSSLNSSNHHKHKIEKLDDLSEYSHSSSGSKERRKSRENHKKHGHSAHSHWSRAFIPNYLHKRKKKHDGDNSSRSRSRSHSPRNKGNSKVEKDNKKRSRSKSKKSRSPDLRKKKKLEEVKPKGVISLKERNNDFKEKT